MLLFGQFPYVTMIHTLKLCSHQETCSTLPCLELTQPVGFEPYLRTSVEGPQGFPDGGL